MQNCSKLFLSKSSNPKMSRTPMDKHWGNRENRGYRWVLAREHLFCRVLRALSLAACSAIAALEPLIFEQGARVFTCAGSRELHSVLFPGLGGTGHLPDTGYSHLGSRCHTCVAARAQPPPAQLGWAVGWGWGTHRDRLFHVFLVEEGVVNAQHNPVEQGTVQRLGHGVSGSDGLWAQRSITP